MTRTATKERLEPLNQTETGKFMEAMRGTKEGKAHLENVFRAVQQHADHKYKKGRQNEGFTQVTDKGWDVMRSLIGANKTAAELYIFLARHTDKTGAVVASQQVLMDELGVARNTLWRACKDLEERGALVRIKVSGNVYAYCLDPFQVWKTYASSRQYAAFLTRTLLPNAAQAERKLTHLMKRRALETQADDDSDGVDFPDDENQEALPFDVEADQ